MGTPAWLEKTTNGASTGNNPASTAPASSQHTRVISRLATYRAKRARQVAELDARDQKRYPGITVPRSGLRRWLFMVVYLVSRRRLVIKPGLTEREERAKATISRAKFYYRKVVSFFTLKGGVGKSTLSKLVADSFKMVKRSLSVLVQDCNRDRGTLGDRGPRTTIFAIIDLVRDLPLVKSLADFARYCNETVHGTLVLASTHADEFHGINRVTRDEFKQVDILERNLFNLVVYDLGTGCDSPTTKGALEFSHCVCIPTTPARDSIAQAKQTFGWMLLDPAQRSVDEADVPDLRDLARNAILVVNRRWPWTSLNRIRAKFVAQFGADFDNVLVMGVGISPILTLGKDVDPAKVRRRVRVQILELDAAIAGRVKDADADDPTSQLSLGELAALGENPQSDAPIVGTVISPPAPAPEPEPEPPAVAEEPPFSDLEDSGRPAWHQAPPVQLPEEVSTSLPEPDVSPEPAVDSSPPADSDVPDEIASDQADVPDELDVLDEDVFAGAPMPLRRRGV